MIVWIDGAFGSGKATLVAELHRRWPEALVFDPEQIGLVLREIVEVPTDNFQDLPLWRTQVAAMAIALLEEYGHPLLVPMTLVEAGYAEEIFTAVRGRGVPLRRVYLDVPADELAAASPSACTPSATGGERDELGHRPDRALRRGQGAAAARRPRAGRAQADRRAGGRGAGRQLTGCGRCSAIARMRAAFGRAPTTCVTTCPRT
jgi:hypothetical protein